MLGFDAVGRLALGQVLSGGVAYSQTLTANVLGTGIAARATGKNASAAISATGSVVKAVAKAAVAGATVAGAAVAAGFFRGIISTIRLHMPVDYFMEGLPQYRAKGRTFEPGRGEAGEDVKVSAGPRGRISGKAPSFTTRTGKRGYD
jgi:hypothetical protein